MNKTIPLNREYTGSDIVHARNAVLLRAARDLLGKLGLVPNIEHICVELHKLAEKEEAEIGRVVS